jgi:hypothetical protein
MVAFLVLDKILLISSKTLSAAGSEAKMEMALLSRRISIRFPSPNDVLAMSCSQLWGPTIG